MAVDYKSMRFLIGRKLYCSFAIEGSDSLLVRSQVDPSETGSGQFDKIE